LDKDAGTGIIRVTGTAYPPENLLIRHHGWYTWAEIAIEQETVARAARATNPVDEFRPSLVAMTAAAFSLDALYGVGQLLIPPPGGDLPKRRASRRPPRGAQVAELLKRGVSPGKLALEWPARITALYEARDDAVHFGEEDAEPVFHPALNSHVAPEIMEWRFEAAEEAVDLLLEVVTNWAHHPSRHTKTWADGARDAVDLLVDGWAARAAD
jgi:hypothetical protein